MISEIKIYPIQTGSVSIKANQRVGKGDGIFRMMNVLFGSEWTSPLPIIAWLIDHPEGLILVDTGETSRTGEPGYFPGWHPYYRLAVRMSVSPSEEVGPQLDAMGLSPLEIKTVVLTHMHTDHAGGLHHFPQSDIYVHPAELASARGVSGRLNGYLPHRWPEWFAPKPVAFRNESFGSFDRVQRLTRSGDVILVPTPGHTPNHLSVIVHNAGLNYFLAGDTSYTEAFLTERLVDGVSPDENVSLGTIDTILDLARQEPTVYLPTHDPESVRRLEHRQVVPVD